MVGFNKGYYDNIPDEYTIPSMDVTLDIKNHGKHLKKGDKIVILPKWDGRSYISFKEMMELHAMGEIGEVIDLSSPYWRLGGDGTTYYKELHIKTTSDFFICHPSYFRIGYKIKNPEPELKSFIKLLEYNNKKNYKNITKRNIKLLNKVN